MNSKMPMRYKNIASYNRETYQFLKFIGLLQIIEKQEKFSQPQINQNKVVITLQEEENISEETEEWAGFVQTMKKFVRKHFLATNQNIQNIEELIQKQDKRLTKIEESQAEMKEMKEMIGEIKEMIQTQQK